jgi:hypothetical protein
VLTRTENATFRGEGSQITSAMRYISVAMLAEHATQSPVVIRRALKRSGLPVERFPGVREIQLTEKNANELIARHWPECGPLPPPSGDEANQGRFAVLENDIHVARQFVAEFHERETINVRTFARLRCQIMALQTVAFEIMGQTGMPMEIFNHHVDVRAAHFLDQLLTKTEHDNPALGAALDDREEGEILTEPGYPPLFPIK